MDDVETATETGTTESTAQPVEKAPEPVKAEGSTDTEKPVKHRSIRAALRAELRKPDGEKAAAKAEKPTEKVEQRPMTAAEAEAILPPPSLNAEERAVWDSLPLQAQRFLSRRSHETTADYNRRMQELQAKERQLSDWGNLGDVREEAQRLGLDPAQTYRTALAWEKAFRTNPTAAAREFLQAYGIDARELINGAPQSNQQAAAGDDRYLTREEFEQMVREREQSISLQENHSAVQKFVESKPLFRDPGTAAVLEAEMEPIVLGLRQSNPSLSVMETLEKAYDIVTRGDPRFSDLLQKVQAREAAEKSNQKAEAARAATRQISGGPGGGTPATKHATRRDALRYFMTQSAKQ